MVASLAKSPTLTFPCWFSDQGGCFSNDSEVRTFPKLQELFLEFRRILTEDFSRNSPLNSTFVDPQITSARSKDNKWSIPQTSLEFSIQETGNRIIWAEMNWNCFFPFKSLKIDEITIKSSLYYPIWVYAHSWNDSRPGPWLCWRFMLPWQRRNPAPTWSVGSMPTASTRVASPPASVWRDTSAPMTIQPATRIAQVSHDAVRRSPWPGLGPDLIFSAAEASYGHRFVINYFSFQTLMNVWQVFAQIAA